MNAIKTLAAIVIVLGPLGLYTLMFLTVPGRSRGDQR